MDNEYISFKQAAEIAGYRNPSSLHTAARAGRLKSTSFGKHAQVTTRAWLDEYLTQVRVGAYKRGSARERADGVHGEEES